MPTHRWVYPIITLIFSIVALVLSLVLYIYWYLAVSDGLRLVVDRFNIDKNQVLEPQTWVVIMVLSILVAFILICIFTIFVYNQKTLQLYRLQNNFINNFTHELKTPVTSLKLYLETFFKHELPRNDQLRYIEYMIQDAERLSENVNQMLNLARIESSAYSPEKAVIDLVKATRDFLTENRHLFETSQIVVNNSSNLAIMFNVNKSLFEMFLMNIITNAIKYNDTDQAIINIDFKQVKKRVRIQIDDNGIGLERSEIKRIFKKFYQVGKSDNRSAKGSGLGLYVAENIARIYNGSLKAESRGKGNGARFILDLPYEPMLNQQGLSNV